MDSDTVDTSLEAFEAQLNAPEEEAAVEVKEVPEPTPSATENESDPDPEDNSDGEDDGEDTPEEQTDEDDANKPKPKKRKNAQERIRELTADKYEMQRRLAALEAAIIEKASQKSEVKPTQTATPAADKAPDPDALKEDGTPVYALGEYDPQFIADLTKHTFKTEREAAKKEAAEEQSREAFTQAQRELTENWQVKVEAASERIPDLDEKFGVLQETFREIPQDYGDFLASSIMMLDNGPDVLEYFADNLDEAKRVIAGGPFAATIALGRLDEKFTKAAKGVEKGSVIPTQAPSPPPKNKGSAVGKVIDPTTTTNLGDFEKVFYVKK